MAGVTTSVEFLLEDWRAAYELVDGQVAAVAGTIRGELVARTPVDRGQLRGAWHVVKQRPADYTIENPTPHAKYVEFGTRHHPAHPMVAAVIAANRGRYGRR